MSNRPDVPRYGSSRVSDVQVCDKLDFVDGRANSLILDVRFEVRIDSKRLGLGSGLTI